MITEKGIQPPDHQELNVFETKFPQLGRWFRLIFEGFANVQTFSQAIDVASVAANAEAVQTFVVSGINTSDVVLVNKPSNSAGLDLVQAWVSDVDELSLKFRNATGSPVDPASETYRIIATRL